LLQELIAYISAGLAGMVNCQRRDRLATIKLLSLVVRLQKGDNPPAWFQPPLGCGDDELLDRPPRVDHDQIDHLRHGAVQRVGSLHHGHSRVAAKLPSQFAVTGVNCKDLCRASLKQAVGEASDITAKVRAHHIRDVQAEGIERCGKLGASARNELRAAKWHDQIIDHAGKKSPRHRFAWAMWLGCRIGLQAIAISLLAKRAFLRDAAFLWIVPLAAT